MKRAFIEQIMQQTGLSQATVYRALGFHGHIDSQTALMVHQLAEALGYHPNSEVKQTPFCGVILPEIPHYYWDSVHASLTEALVRYSISYQSVLFSNFFDLEFFFLALDSLLDFSPKVLVIAAPNHPEVKKRLLDISKTIPIFLLGERIHAKNIFYFGRNDLQDGIALGKAFRQAYPDRSRILVLDIPQHELRTEGFLSVCNDMEAVGRIQLPICHSGYSSILARSIVSKVTEPFDCVYCSTGMLPRVCLALDKLKIDPNVICIGYENPPANRRFWQNGRIGLTLCQDIAAQSAACAKAVAKLYTDRCFPDRKNNYIEFRILFPPGKATETASSYNV